MARVVFSSELQKLTGEERCDVDAFVYRDIIARLVEKYPELEQDKLMEMAVSIDGEIIHDPYLEVVNETSEVHFLFRISGG